MSTVRKRRPSHSGEQSKVEDNHEPTSESQTPVPPTLFVPLNTAFYLTVAAHVLAALYAPIQDCDETFNYWEPLHYLVHGYGLQTWEYSPEFSIRSWAYIWIHKVPIQFVSFIGKSKAFQFYALRVVFALICGVTETRLYSAISRTLNPRIGVFYLMIVTFTPGFFYASTAFLPSSFAMYTSTLGLAAFMDWHGGAKTARGIMWFAAGALLGWPFAGALIIPFCVEDLVVAYYRSDFKDLVKRYLDGALRASLLMLWQVSVDTSFYKQFVIVPWNIVAYNVFGGQGRGPNIFGTEPWHYYVRNLLLNFNVWFLFAILAAPLLAIQFLFFRQQSSQQTMVRTAVFVAPFYLWLAIFTAQPHKEERFMFPAYPFLALNAAIGFHMVLTWLSVTDSKKLIGRIPAQLRAALILLVVLLSLNVGLLRIFGTITAYQAPLNIYKELELQPFTPGDIVCIGKDWYRFPSSFHLPNPIHAKFIKSAFDGLLPGDFLEDHVDHSSRPGTWVMPQGMNDQNIEDFAKHIPIDKCTYLVDSHFTGTKPSALEPAFALSKEWSQIKCASFLDVSKSNLLARTIWLPNLPFVPRRLQRVWGMHCLFRRKV